MYLNIHNSINPYARIKHIMMKKIGVHTIRGFACVSYFCVKRRDSRDSSDWLYAVRLEHIFIEKGSFNPKEVQADGSYLLDFDRGYFSQNLPDVTEEFLQEQIAVFSL